MRSPLDSARTHRGAGGVCGGERDVDELPEVLPAEHRQRGGDPVQDTPQVDLDHQVPLVDLQFVQVRYETDTGVVDHDVEAPEFVDGGGDQVDDLAAVGNVDGNRHRGAAAAPDLFGDPPGGGGVAVGEHDLRPAFSQQARGRATDAATGAGDDYYLRHTGNHIASATGANLRELMGRMGHSTTRAALIYQHRTTERDRLIAAAMSQLVEAELDAADKPSGTQRARGGRNEAAVEQEES